MCGRECSTHTHKHKHTYRDTLRHTPARAAPRWVSGRLGPSQSLLARNPRLQGRVQEGQPALHRTLRETPLEEAGRCRGLAQALGRAATADGSLPQGERVYELETLSWYGERW